MEGWLCFWNCIKCLFASVEAKINLTIHPACLKKHLTPALKVVSICFLYWKQLLHSHEGEDIGEGWQDFLQPQQLKQKELLNMGFLDHRLPINYVYRSSCLLRHCLQEPVSHSVRPCLPCALLNTLSRSFIIFCFSLLGGLECAEALLYWR